VRISECQWRTGFGKSKRMLKDKKPQDPTIVTDASHTSRKRTPFMLFQYESPLAADERIQNPSIFSV
jgi:hypothetical protein